MSRHLSGGTEKIAQVSRSPGRDMNTKSPEYDLRAPKTRSPCFMPGLDFLEFTFSSLTGLREVFYQDQCQLIIIRHYNRINSSFLARQRSSLESKAVLRVVNEDPTEPVGGSL